MKNKILIIGKIPPPIGGVTIHVQRFIEHLKKDQIDYILLDYSKFLNFFFLFKKYDLVHIHVSNKIFRLLLILFIRLLNKKSIVTYHGNYDFKNKYDRYSLMLSNKNILLNEDSINVANTISNNNILIGAFIPPLNINVALEEKIINKIQDFREQFSTIYCMNASDYVFDKNGNEIYQGSDLISFFYHHQDYGLIFSDPSGKYTDKFEGYSNNILFLNIPHQFVDIFKFADYMIRFTTTDGDSLSVKEALYFELKVFASDCVERSKGVKLIKSIEEILDVNFENVEEYIPSNNYKDILNIYKMTLNK